MTTENDQGELLPKTEHKDVFHTWESISLYRHSGTTFDLVIRNTDHLMSLIQYIHKYVYKTNDKDDNLFLYKRLKIKMKISFEAWN